MALKSYVPFDWHNLGEPLTPFVSLQFRGSEAFLYTFPSKSNRIYVENATFSVLDENGYSTASITLADPDFVNLEMVFMKALFLANSLTIGNSCWFCSALWGWSSYGKDIDGSTKTSGRHFYMLKNLTYDLTDTELRVQVDLMDVGHSTFGTQDSNSPKLSVGKLNRVPNASGVSVQGEGGSTSNSQADTADAVERWAKMQIVNKLTDEGGGVIEGRYVDGEIDADVAGGASTAQEGTATQENLQNIISDKTYWQIIQLLFAAQDLLATSSTSKNDPSIPTDKPPGDGKYTIPTNSSFTEEVDKLIKAIKPFPEPDKPTNGKPTKHWDILAGGKVDPKDKNAKIATVFGWKQDPPKGTYQTTSFEDNYRLARTLVYRPSNKEEIARGETMINSLRYNWTSRGYLGVGLPPVYGITSDTNGKLSVYTTTAAWQNRDPKQNTILGKENATSRLPPTKVYTLEDIQKLNGVEVQFNFDSRTMTKEVLEGSANAIIINVWNYFLYELIDVSLELPGDPWLDNTLFLDGKDYRNNDYLVDLYNSYFKVKVYKIGVGAQNQLSEILTGNYLCLKGCVHSISEGEYTTALTLMKSF
jgi:hypothetical protein